jgi:hypothetical protein
LNSWFQSKKHNMFCKKSSLGQKKLVKDGENGTRHVNLWGCFHANSNSYINSLCFKNHPIPRNFWIQPYNYFLLRKAIINSVIRSMPNLQVWAITQVVIDTLRHVV